MSTAELRLSEQWEHVPGEGLFKLILDEHGTVRGSVQARDGDFILGSRNASNGRLIFFATNNFATEAEALGYFREWVQVNPHLATTD